MTPAFDAPGGGAAPPVRTTCAYCGVGCGVLARPDGAGGATVEGDPDHPANLGRLCSKGSALGETLDLEGRLLAPRVNGVETGWDEAVGLVARRFREAIAEHGPDSVAFYVSGQLLTEDYYVANKLMKGFIGSANIDTNSRLCMSSSVAGHRRAFGGDVVPGVYEDLEEADLIVLVGSNLAWCHPVLFQRIAAAKAARPEMRVVNVDPRSTATSDLADVELRLAAGSDVALFNGLLNRIVAEDAVDAAWIAAHVTGFDGAAEAAADCTIDRVSSVTGIGRRELARFYAEWIGAEKVVTIYSQGVNQSSSGTDKVNAILNCHLATGRIGKPGMGPFSVTGQPNAMGGREVGGLANTLACHLDIENPEHRAAVQAHWHSPTICKEPGLKAVDLFRACADGRIKALWIMATNPAVSLPEAESVRAAIEACPFVVVSDVMADTDTTRLADVLLPAAAWGEKSGTVTNSERTISRQRAFLPAPGLARPDWRIICDVAAAMGWGSAFAYDGPAGIFREHAALSGVARHLGNSFDISGLAEIDDAAYEALTPVRWPVRAPGAGSGRLFASGGFPTEDGKARMLPLTHRPPRSMPSPEFPLRLNTGRARDHWHTMTRTAKSPRLSRHMAEPFVEIHPADAARRGVAPASLVHVRSAHGAVVMRALVTDRTPEGAVFAPMHWNDRWASAACVDALVRAETDPVSGQPESKGSVAEVTPFRAAWYAFGISREEMQPASDYWAKARVDGGWQVELAGAKAPCDWDRFARDLFDLQDAAAVSFADSRAGAARIALTRNGRPVAVLFASREPVAVARRHALAALASGEVGAQLLAGRPGADRPDPGAIICSCYDVGVNTIRAAIADGGVTDLESLQSELRAGTGCGSCRPELRTLLKRLARVAPESAQASGGPPAFAVGRS